MILGGDHYFRFNHPVEVQKVKGLSCGTTLLHDGPKDFEFAKNELLIAQRAQYVLHLFSFTKSRLAAVNAALK